MRGGNRKKGNRKGERQAKLARARKAGISGALQAGGYRKKKKDKGGTR